MGIQSQNDLLWKSSPVALDDIVYLLEERHGERRRSNPPSTERARPKVSIDASLVAYKYLNTALDPWDGVWIISTALADRNIDVHVICDPPIRHHSKRAHQQRVGKKAKSSLRLMVYRMELASLRNDPKNDDADMAAKISEKIRSLEKAECRALLPPDFVARLQDKVRTYESQGYGDITIEVAPYQADPCIADLAIRGGCEAIVSGDSDFPMYVGPGGPDKLSDIMLRDIKINRKQYTIRDCTLVTGQRAVAEKIDEILLRKRASAATVLTPVCIQVPKFPASRILRPVRWVQAR
jgi:hypothetical protein